MTEHHPLENHEPGSLRGRLIRRLAVLLALILLVSSLSAYWSARHAADTAYDRTLLLRRGRLPTACTPPPSA